MTNVGLFSASGATEGTASHKVRPYPEKNQGRVVPGVGPDLVSGRSVRRAPKRGNGLTQGEALP